MDYMEYLMILQWKLIVEIEEFMEKEKRNYFAFYIAEEM